MVLSVACRRRQHNLTVNSKPTMQKSVHIVEKWKEHESEIENLQQFINNNV